LSKDYFGEGITIFGNQLYQLTWQSHVGIVYDRATFAKQRRHLAAPLTPVLIPILVLALTRDRIEQSVKRVSRSAPLPPAPPGPPALPGLNYAATSTLI